MIGEVAVWVVVVIGLMILATAVFAVRDSIRYRKKMQIQEPENE